MGCVGAASGVLGGGPQRFVRHGRAGGGRAGHDTDTVGAIAGALLGARYGRTAIAAEYQATLHGWPGIDANDLADLALRVAR